ncbi:MAG: ribosome biogenesis GTP-binding protein YihA/YsxC [Nitrospiria bacterium]
MKITAIEYVRAAPRWDDGPKDGLPEVALIGRSNVGKSSLVNLLLGRKAAHVAKTPGKTQLLQYFLINRSFYLVDLPGYGYAKVGKQVRNAWGPMINAYLTKRATLRAVGLLIDIRRADSPLDMAMKDWLDFHHIPAFFIATKSDKIAKGKRKAQIDRIRSVYGMTDLHLTSSLKKEGRTDVWRAIESVISDRSKARG